MDILIRINKELKENQPLSDKITMAINSEFIGNIQFTESELEKINDFACEICKTRQAPNSLAQIEYYLLFISAVNALKNWTPEEESRMWDYLEKKFDTSNNIYKKYLTSAIDWIYKKSYIYVDIPRQKYYFLLTSQALSPTTSIKSFFDLSWSVYSNDLNYSFYDIESKIPEIAIELNKIFSHDLEPRDKKFTLGSKVYQIWFGIKGLALSQLETLLKEAIDGIDKLYNGYTIDTTLYLNTLLESWWKEKSKSFGKTKPARNEYRESKESIDDIIPKYIMESDTIFIFIQSFRLQEKPYSVPYVILYQDKTIIKEEQLRINEESLLPKTEPYWINLNDLTPSSLNLTLEIKLGNKQPSKKYSMVRHFLLFKNKQEIHASCCPPGNYLLYIPSYDTLLQHPAGIITRNNKNQYLISAQNGESLQSRTKTIFFKTEETRENIIIYGRKFDRAKFQYQGDDYIIFTKEPIQIAIQDNDAYDLKDIGISINNTSFRIQELTFEKNTDTYYFNLLDLVSDSAPIKINIFSYKSNKILLTESFIFFKQMDITFDKPFYYGSFNNSSAQISINDNIITKSFSPENNQLTAPYQDGYIVIEIPVIEWNIEGEEKHHKFEEKEIWYEEIGNNQNFNIFLPPSLSGELILSNGHIISPFPNSNNTYPLGQTIHSLAEKGGKNLKVSFKMSNSTSKIDICKIAFKDRFPERPFEIFKKQIEWNPENYIGAKGTKFTLIISSMEKGGFYSTFEVSTDSQSITLPASFQDGYYTFTIERIENFFTKKKKIISKCNLLIGDEKTFKFKGKKIAISKVFLNNENKRQPLAVTYYIDNAEYLKTENGFDYYYGSLYIKNADGSKHYLNMLKDDNGEDENVNPIQIIKRSEKSCWLDYGFDKETGDFEAEFTLDSSNLLSIQDHKIRLINYYYYEVYNV